MDQTRWEQDKEAWRLTEKDKWEVDLAKETHTTSQASAGVPCNLTGRKQFQEEQLTGFSLAAPPTGLSTSQDTDRPNHVTPFPGHPSLTQGTQ